MSDQTITEGPIAFVQQMNRCWLERRFDDLIKFFAADVVVVGSDGKRCVKSAHGTIEDYREFMDRSDVRRFEPSNWIVTHSGSAAVVEYDWEIEWSDGGTEHAATGREVVALDGAEGWRIIWRMLLRK